MSPRLSQITESPIKAPPFLELCCVIGDNGISMNLHRRRREINGSSPSWRIKKKKSYGARAEVEIHESTYVVGVHFSQAPKAWTPANLRKVAARIRGPGSRRLPQPAARAARCPRSTGSPAAGAQPEDPRPGPERPGPAPPAPVPPRDVQSKP